MGESFRRSLEAEYAAPKRIETILRRNGMPTEVSKITREHVESFSRDRFEVLSASL